jgi:hypothetical protein
MKILSVYFKGHFIGGFSLLKYGDKAPQKNIVKKLIITTILRFDILKIHLEKAGVHMEVVSPKVLNNPV